MVKIEKYYTINEGKHYYSTFPSQAINRIIKNSKKIDDVSVELYVRSKNTGTLNYINNYCIDRFLLLNKNKLSLNINDMISLSENNLVYMLPDLLEFLNVGDKIIDKRYMLKPPYTIIKKSIYKDQYNNLIDIDIIIKEGKEEINLKINNQLKYYERI